MRTVTNSSADAKLLDTGKFRALTLVPPLPAGHHAPSPPDPELADVLAVISDEFYAKRWNEAIAHVLRGDLRPRRPRPDRHSGGDFRPGHLSPVPEGRRPA